jgi:dihydrodipicolinate synthase/N-acetylneuraminate lyase
MWNSMIYAVRRGDLAHANKCQRMQNKMLDAIFSKGFNDGVHKRLLKYVWGFTLGPVRCPISEPSDQHWAEIEKQLDAMNYREFAKAKF